MDAMTQEKLFALTRARLIKLAKEYKIKNYGRLTKQALVERLLEARRTAFQEQEMPAHPETHSFGEQEDVEETKYYLGPVPAGWKSEEELPAHYGDKKIVLMVRDPYWIFAYWEVAPQHLAQIKLELKDQWEDCKKILRIYDVTGRVFNGANANSYFDLEVNGADNWYINVNRPNHSYCAELGLLTPQGSFYFLARSNQVTTPLDSPSVLLDEKWMNRRRGPEQICTKHTPEECVFEWERGAYSPLHSEMGSEYLSQFSTSYTAG